MRIGRKLSSFLSKKTKFGKTQREALGKRLKSGRERDRKSLDPKANIPEEGWNVVRDLRTMGKFKPVFITSLNRIKQKRNRPLKILDVGAGLGYLGNDLRFYAGQGSIVHGLKLTLSGKEERKIVRRAMNEELIGSIENYRFRTKYDLIVSIAGGTVYTANLPIAIEKICNALNPGGEAIIHVMPERIEPLIKPLKENGFKFEFIPDSKKRFVRIINFSGKRLKLTTQIKQELKKPIKDRLSVDLREN
jgi:SAM-dependent methyltransferase